MSQEYLRTSKELNNPQKRPTRTEYNTNHSPVLDSTGQWTEKFALFEEIYNYKPKQMRNIKGDFKVAQITDAGGTNSAP